MKRTPFLSISIILAASILFSNCGGSSSSSSSTTSKPPVSNIKKRVFITNTFFGSVGILDAANDVGGKVTLVNNVATLTFFSISTGGNPTFMVFSPGQFTMAYRTNDNIIALLDNTNETVVSAITLPGATESVVLSPDSKFAYAALRNSGQVAVIDIVNKTATIIGNIPQARQLVMSHNGATLLVISDNSDAVTLVKTADKSMTTVTGFDRPYNAIFSTDDSKAYVLSCGRECGGIAAAVNVLDVAGLAVTGTATVPGGATVGLLSGSTLYVAGNDFSVDPAGVGKISTVDVGSLAVAQKTAISNGTHTVMALTPDGKLYIGAKACTNTTQGCLSIYNTSAGTAKVGTVAGDVTSILPIKDRKVVYAVEGGNLRIYDTTTDALQATQINIPGAVYDVKEID